MNPPVTIRAAGCEDAPVLRRLAALDSAPVPVLPALLLEEGTEPRAAVSLADGAVVADPFHRTLELVALLELRAEHVRPPPSGAPGGGARESRRRGRAALSPLAFGHFSRAGE